MELLIKLLQQKWFQLAAALFAGITIGALFYSSRSVSQKSEQQLKQEFLLKEQATQQIYAAQTKKLTDQLTTEESDNKQFRQETSLKIRSLTMENDSLKKSTHHQMFKIIKPDGTIIEKEMDSSNVQSTRQVVTQIKQEFNQKIKSIENKWKTIHRERVAQITKQYNSKLEKIKAEEKVLIDNQKKEKTVDVNKRSMGVEVGYMSNKDLYLHTTYTLWGPVFIGGGISGTSSSFGEVHAGLGIKF